MGVTIYHTQQRGKRAIPGGDFHHTGIAGKFARESKLVKSVPLSVGPSMLGLRSPGYCRASRGPFLGRLATLTIRGWGDNVTLSVSPL